MNADSETIAVVIAVHNQASHLYRTISSCVWQLAPRDELIVVDDASTDLTDHRGDAMLYKRALWLTNKSQRGVSFSRNRAIERSRAHWIKFLDADDVLVPFALDFLRETNRVLPSNIQTITGGCHRLIDGKYADFLSGGEEGLKSILTRNPLLPSATFVRRQALLDVGMFDERIDFEEDWDLWLKLHERFGLGSFAITDYPLCYYWIHHHERSLKPRRYVVDRVPVRDYFRARYGVQSI